jgi:hypothetical protein
MNQPVIRRSVLQILLAKDMSSILSACAMRGDAGQPGADSYSSGLVLAYVASP